MCKYKTFFILSKIDLKNFFSPSPNYDKHKKNKEGIMQHSKRGNWAERE